MSDDPRSHSHCLYFSLCFRIQTLLTSPPVMAFSLCKSFFWLSLPVLLAVVAGYALHFHAPPAFDVATLARVASEARLKFPEPQGSVVTAEDRLRHLEQSVAFISSELARSYPRHIHPGGQWITNLAGGFKTGMIILHASLTEYVSCCEAHLREKERGQHEERALRSEAHLSVCTLLWPSHAGDDLG